MSASAATMGTNELRVYDYSESDKKIAQQVAATILNQLGGGRFCAMIGANSMFSHNEGRGGLSMRIGRNRANVNYVRWTLNEMDTYDVEYCRVQKFSCTLKKRDDGIYGDMLTECFESATGMKTHL